jgi:hypothetical protein
VSGAKEIKEWKIVEQREVGDNEDREADRDIRCLTLDPFDAILPMTKGTLHSTSS